MASAVTENIRPSMQSTSILPERDLAMTLRRAFTHSFQSVIESVSQDRRDEWATDLKEDYSKGDVLSSGHFGMVVAAHGRDFTFGGRQAQPRACAIKVLYLARRFDRALEETKGDKAKFIRRIDSIVHKIVTELYILNRCRHENIMHSHAVAVTGGDLYIILPRLYSLESLIDKYRQRTSGESMPARVIMMVVRQICTGLDFLSKVGIIHRDIQAEYIYLTRGGTVKLGHFSSARVESDGECMTPVGKKEYMCFEKQFNLYSAASRSECLEYDGAADVWAIGVLVLRMVSYFPNEKWHRLQSDFATVMHTEKMPFKWMIAEMMQLRVRLAKCGGPDADLRGWLSDKAVPPVPSPLRLPLRCSSSIRPVVVPPRSYFRLRPSRNCAVRQTVSEDKQYLAKHLIQTLDWPNRLKLETNRPNYDALESKDIPAEFYWDENDSWKIIETKEFAFEVSVEENAIGGYRRGYVEGRFIFSSVHDLLRQLGQAVADGRLSHTDILPIDHHIRELCYVALKNTLNTKMAARPTDVSFTLPENLNASSRRAAITVAILEDCN